jgi:hypothetical protein
LPPRLAIEGVTIPIYGYGQHEIDQHRAANLARWTQNYRLLGDPIRGTLENLPQRTLPAKKTRCYAAIVVLDEDAHIDNGASFSVYLASRGNRAGSGLTEFGKGIFVAPDLCMSAESSRLEFLDGHDGIHHATRVGSGGFTLSLYERVLDDNQVRQVKGAEKVWACSGCQMGRRVCEKTNSPQYCFMHFQGCLKSSSIEPRQCPYER